MTNKQKVRDLLMAIQGGKTDLDLSVDDSVHADEAYRAGLFTAFQRSVRLDNSILFIQCQITDQGRSFLAGHSR